MSYWKTQPAGTPAGDPSFGDPSFGEPSFESLDELSPAVASSSQAQATSPSRQKNKVPPYQPSPPRISRVTSDMSNDMQAILSPTFDSASGNNNNTGSSGPNTNNNLSFRVSPNPSLDPDFSFLSRSYSADSIIRKVEEEIAAARNAATSAKLRMGEHNNSIIMASNSNNGGENPHRNREHSLCSIGSLGSGDEDMKTILEVADSAAATAPNAANNSDNNIISTDNVNRLLDTSYASPPRSQGQPPFEQAMNIFGDDAPEDEGCVEETIELVYNGSGEDDADADTNSSSTDADIPAATSSNGEMFQDEEWQVENAEKQQQQPPPPITFPVFEDKSMPLDTVLEAASSEELFTSGDPTFDESIDQGIEQQVENVESSKSMDQEQESKAEPVEQLLESAEHFLKSAEKVLEEHESIEVDPESFDESVEVEHASQQAVEASVPMDEDNEEVSLVSVQAEKEKETEQESADEKSAASSTEAKDSPAIDIDELEVASEADTPLVATIEDSGVGVESNTGEPQSINEPDFVDTAAGTAMEDSSSEMVQPASSNVSSDTDSSRSDAPADVDPVEPDNQIIELAVTPTTIDAVDGDSVVSNPPGIERLSSAVEELKIDTPGAQSEKNSAEDGQLKIEIPRGSKPEKNSTEDEKWFSDIASNDKVNQNAFAQDAVVAAAAAVAAKQPEPPTEKASPSPVPAKVDALGTSEKANPVSAEPKVSRPSEKASPVSAKVKVGVPSPKKSAAISKRAKSTPGRGMKATSTSKLLITSSTSPRHSPRLSMRTRPKRRGESGGENPPVDEVDLLSRDIRFRNPFPTVAPSYTLRNPITVIDEHTTGVPVVRPKWLKPTKTLTQLIVAVVGSSLQRRSNACGALKVLAKQKKNQVSLVRTDGFLSSIIFAIRQNISSSDRALALDARTRAMATLRNVCEPKENRIRVFTHPGLSECLMKVIREDPGEGRVLACGALALLAKTTECREGMANTDGLVALLSEVLRGVIVSPKPDPDNRERNDAVESDSSDGSSDNEDDDNSVQSESSCSSAEESRDAPGSSTQKFDSVRKTAEGMHDEFLQRSRLNSCAALLHLSKHCPVTVRLHQSTTVVVMWISCAGSLTHLPF